MDEDKRGWLDIKLGKFASRKLLVFFFSTVFLILNFISAEQWVMIATAYVGIVGFSDVVRSWSQGMGERRKKDEA